MCTAIAQAHCLAAAHAPSCKMFCTREVGLSQRPYCVFSRSRHVIDCHRTSLCIFVMSKLSKGPFSEEMLPPTPSTSRDIPWSHGHPTVRVLESCTAPISDDTFTSGRATPWKENANFGPCRRCRDACCILLLYVVICCSIMCICRRFSNAPP